MRRRDKEEEIKESQLRTENSGDKRTEKGRQKMENVCKQCESNSSRMEKKKRGEKTGDREQEVVI